MKKAVFGLANNETLADRIVNRLIDSGFLSEEISILYPDTNKKMTIVNERGQVEFNRKNVKSGSLSTEKRTKAPEGGVAGATAGGILGGSLGLLAGIGALAIPGFGPFVAAGPIMAALSGSAVGGSLGLLIGALVGAGIPEYEAKKYETALKAGNILISVHTETDEEVKLAKDIMQKEGAKDISVTNEKVKSSY